MKGNQLGAGISEAVDDYKNNRRINEYGTHYAAGKEYADPEIARGNCPRATAEFYYVLKDKGIDSQQIGTTFGPEGHYANLLADGTVIDWTARQFDAKAPVPLVLPQAKWKERFPGNFDVGEPDYSFDEAHPYWRKKGEDGKEFACDSKACAPPPTGTGGSRKGAATPSLKVTRTEKAFGPRTVKAKVKLKPETEEQCETGDGDCYPAAGRYYLSKTGFQSKPTPGITYALVHGTVTGNGGRATGKRFGHAWVEETTNVGVWVVDKSNGNDVRIPREHYYAIGRIKENEVQRYTDTEPAVKMLKSKHWGPWD